MGPTLPSNRARAVDRCRLPSGNRSDTLGRRSAPTLPQRLFVSAVRLNPPRYCSGRACSDGPVRAAFARTMPRRDQGREGGYRLHLARRPLADRHCRASRYRTRSSRPGNAVARNLQFGGGGWFGPEGVTAADRIVDAGGGPLCVAVGAEGYRAGQARDAADPNRRIGLGSGWLGLIRFRQRRRGLGGSATRQDRIRQKRSQCQAGRQAEEDKMSAHRRVI